MQGSLGTSGAVVLLAGVCCSLASRAQGERPTWLDPPQLAIMTGFIKDPAEPQSIEEWREGLGAEFDADDWVRAFREAGAAYLIFYDKWIDGLVFHDTATTSFQTERDFLREVADACHTQALPLVIYWNAAYDNNPEFADFVTRDAAGNPILFPEPWPCRLLSMHSPFRQKAQEQVREILGSYGPIAALWLDCYGQPWPATDSFTAKAFEERHHTPVLEAPPELGQEFVLTTLVEYLDDLRDIAAELQPDLRFTTNGSGEAPMGAPYWSASLLSPLAYLSVEGHQLTAMDSQAAAASFLQRPLEIGDLISTSWFSPPGAKVTPARGRRAISEAAIAWCQGANVYLALTPSHEGTFGEELAVVRQAGQWLRARRELLAESAPWPDVGIVLGAPAPTLRSHPSLNQLWQLAVGGDPGDWAQAQQLHRLFAELGYGSRILYELGDLAAWPEELSQFRALVVPERAGLGEEHVARLREYVRGGGRLLAFGHASLLGSEAEVRNEFALADVLGLHHVGRAAFPPEGGPAQCFADSEWSTGFAARNLVDGTAAAWASADTPMPHWAQVNLPTPEPVARVRVTAREGEYLLRDFEVFTWTGEDWETVQTFRDNKDRAVDCAIDPPRSTLGVRVVVKAETYQGNDRNLADLEEIQLSGPAGELLSLAPDAAYRLKARIEDKSLGTQAGERSIAGPALLAESSGAEVLASFAEPTGGAAQPLVTRHRFGAGTAFWVAVGEAGVTGDSPYWGPTLARLAAGPSGVSWDRSSRAGGAIRHRVILRQRRVEPPPYSGLVICVIDTQPEAAPENLRLRLQPERLGLRGDVDPAADGERVSTRQEGGRLILEVTPDPAATVLVR